MAETKSSFTMVLVGPNFVPGKSVGGEGGDKLGNIEIDNPFVLNYELKYRKQKQKNSYYEHTSVL